MSEQANGAPPSLVDVATQSAPPDVYGGIKPILLSDPQTVWVVTQGEVDLFSVPQQGGDVIGAASMWGRSTPRAHARRAGHARR
ncbi:MAG: hypothetical protein R3A10_02065 [Caldilineaceae bacterium]